MRVWVTGAEGFVGRHLVAGLRGAGHEVLTADLEVDVTDAALVERAVARARPEAIVHLAAQSSAARSLRDPAGTYRVNFHGTWHVLEAARRHAPGARVLFVSSADVYGSAAPGAPPFDEDAPLRPATPYGRSKVAADRLAARYGEQGLDVVVLRPFNHTGPGQSDSFVLASFARQIAAIERGQAAPLLRVGNLDSVRDFLDVEDVVAAYLTQLAPGGDARVLNIASGVGRPLREGLHRLLALAAVDARIEVDPARVRPTDHSVGCADRLRALTGWAPAIPFERTLERLLADWRQRLDDR